MARSHSPTLTLFLLTMFSYVLSRASAGRLQELTEEEDLELERRLRVINKPARESFETEYGDTIDCVDIYKQLAFDHPLLKNHRLQVKPKKITKEGAEKTPSRNARLYLQKIERCPESTVPIVRATKEDLLMAKHLPSYLAELSPGMKDINATGRMSAVRLFHGQNYGASAVINEWSPSVLPDQLSGAIISIVNGLDVPGKLNNIQAGWLVNPYLYKSYTRLFAYWTADSYQKTGCYNVLCPGFVQVSMQIPLGLILRPTSVPGGPQYDIILEIYQDTVSGHWWLRFGDEDVGYWPTSLFTTMKSRASDIAWGGMVYSPTAEASPPMGSGFFPHQGPNKTAYITRFLYSDQHGNFVDPADGDLALFVDRPKCYDADGGATPKMGHYIYYGGPGRCLG